MISQVLMVSRADCAVQKTASEHQQSSLVAFVAAPNNAAAVPKFPVVRFADLIGVA
jgi:hypothetical protein